MKGDAKVIMHLNRVLTNELTAIDQYFLHAKMFKHWGFGKLAAVERKESIDEMNHADALMERILFLEGLPNLQDLHKLLIGENVEEALACDLKLELAAHPVLKTAIADSEGCGDYVSRDLFRRILDSEEEHIDWLETQLELIGKVGIANYQQSQMTVGMSGRGLNGASVRPPMSDAPNQSRDASANTAPEVSRPPVTDDSPRVICSDALLAGQISPCDTA